MAVALYIASIPKNHVTGHTEQSTQHDQSVHEQSASVTIGTGDFGKGHEGTLVFVLESCEGRNKALTCSLTVASPGYDRVLFFPALRTRITDAHDRVFLAATGTPVITLTDGAAFQYDLQAG